MRNERNIKKVVLWKRVVIPLTTLIIFYTVFGFFVVPLIGKSVLQGTLSEKLGRQVTIDDIDLNPYALTLSVEGLNIREPGGSETFVSFGRFYLDFQVISSFKRAIVVREIRLEEPYVNLIRHEENQYNFSDLVGEKKPEPGVKQAGASQLPRFSLNNIQLSGGAVHIWDGTKRKEHHITEVDVGVPVISSLPYDIDIFVQPHFSARFNETPVSLAGKTKPFADSRQTILDIDLSSVNIPYYLAYVPLELNFKMLSGDLDVKGAVTYVQKRKSSPSLSVEGQVALKNLEIVDAEDHPVLKLPLLRVSIASVEPFARKIHVSEVLIESPEVNVTRAQDGTINLQTLLPAQEEDSGESPSEGTGQALSFTVDETKVAGGKITFADVSGSQVFETTLDPVDLAVRNFKSEEGSLAGFDFSMLTEDNESLKLGGEFSVNPFAAEGSLALDGLAVGKYGPYMPDQVQIIVKDGKFSTKGDLTLTSSLETGFTSSYRGEVVFSDLVCVDKVHTEDLLKWKSLRFDELDIRVNPVQIHIGEIVLDEPFVNVIVHEDKKLNLQTIVAEKGQEESPSTGGEFSGADEGEAPAGALQLGKVSLKEGRVHFRDKSIKPSYSTKLTDIQATLTGLTSQEAEGAEVALKGKLDKHAPLEIKGRVNPLKEDLFVDLKVGLKNVELSPVTPYSSRFVGYTIGKGELSLDLEYLIKKSNLKSQNRFFVDQLTFGEKVDSPEATNLPVTLGVALLKNRNGEIDLNIPVSGSIDDPEFKVGKIIWKTIVNLFVKAATSPFALLGAVVGGGEELSVVEFDYGRSVIPEPDVKKLDTLIKALYDRPSLKLDIEGHVDLEKDRDGLKEYLFEKKLKAQKMKELMKKGSPTISVDEVNIEPDEYEDYLRKAYKEESFEKPRNFIGLAKKLPVSETEALILEHITVEDDDLRLLALGRARAVEAYLLDSEMIEPGRIFLVEPRSLAPEEKEGLKDSRVDLKLK